MKMGRNRWTFVGLLGAALLLSTPGCPGRGPELRLSRVVLHQNGVGSFEYRGRPRSGALELRLGAHEVNDVLKTLTVVGGGEAALRPVSGVSVQVTGERPAAGEAPQEGAAREARLRLDLGQRPKGEVVVAYSVPTPQWKATYRLVLPEQGGAGQALLQAWALVQNRSAEPWRQVALTLATGAPFSYAVDLQRPAFARRPDGSGHLVQPAVTGVVQAETGRSGDLDGDGVGDAEDLCPSDAEDRDGFEDQDGCPDPDNDRDRIDDAKDLCPNEPETYNGSEDEDGCPDRGRVVVQASRLTILDKIYFADGAAALRRASRPIVEAVAATLKANPQVKTVELQGHASAGEPDPWGLSAARAAAVKAALLRAGVATARLRTRALGASRPVARDPSTEARARNRRVEFRVIALDAGDEAQGGGVTREALGAAVRAAARPVELAGVVRYRIATPVSVERGATLMVPVINEAVPGEEVYLFRPDAAVPGSEQHPLKAARLQNGQNHALAPGPAAIYRGGAFVGEGMLAALAPGESTFVPYALDAATTVSREEESERQPARLVAVSDGVARVEDTLLRKTRYEVQCGASVPGRLFVHHRRAAGHRVRGLPAGSRTTDAAYLVPLALAPSGRRTLTVSEERPVQRRLPLLGHTPDGPSLAAYLEGSELPRAVGAALRQVVALRAKRRQAELRLDALQQQLSSDASVVAELRANLASLGKGGRTTPLGRRLVGRIAAAQQRLEVLGPRVGEAAAQRTELVLNLRKVVDGLSWARAAETKTTGGGEASGAEAPAAR